MNYEEWKRKRTWSFINFCLADFIYGIGVTIYQPTEFYYFKDTMKVEDPAFSFGLSVGLFQLGGIISLFITSVYYDKYNRIRHFFLLSNVVAMLGNVLYLAYYSQVIVMTGQLLIGAVIGRAVISIAEAAMLYEPKELAKRIGILSICSSVGFAITPCAPFLFALVDVQVDWWQLNINNMLYLVMAVLYSISLIVSFFTLEDLSLVHNVKTGRSRLMKQKYTDGDVNKGSVIEHMRLLDESDSKEDTPLSESDSEVVDVEEAEQHSEAKKQRPSYVALMRLLLSDKLVVGVLGHCFLTSFSLVWGFLLIPIYAAEYLQWTPRDVAVVSIVSVVAGCVPTAVVLSAFANRITNIDKLIYSSFLQVVFTLLYLFPYIEGRISKEVVLYVFMSIGASFFYASAYGSMTLLANLVPPEIQASTEGSRYGITLAASVTAGWTVFAPSTYELASLGTLMFLTTARFVLLVVMRPMYISKSLRQGSGARQHYPEQG